MSSRVERATNARWFLLLHGFTGSGPQHWQSWLADELRGRGERVLFPQLPEPDSPRLAEWLDSLRRHLESLSGARLVVLAHSCGALLWMHHAASAVVARPAERVLLVAPPGPKWHDPDVGGFEPPPLEPAAMFRAARRTRLVTGTDDPHCEPDEAAAYASAMDIPHDRIAVAGHINSASGYGPWPSVLEWALEERTPIVGAGQAL